MNEKNLKYLKEGMKFKGFENAALNAEMEQNIQKNVPEFQLHFEQDYFNDKMKYDLHFRKGNEDVYFFNKFNATLVNGEGQGKDRSQMFYTQGHSAMTNKEAYNLLSGRAVKKTLMRKLTPEETAKYKAELNLPAAQRGLPENWEKAPTYKAWVQLKLDGCIW